MATTSKRFETTTKAGLQATADRFNEIEDRAAVLRRLQERKVANATASIILGSHQIQYQSTMNSSNASVREALKNAGSTNIQEIARQNRDMKAALTRTHFEMGFDNVDYSTSNTMEDTTGRIHEYHCTLNEKNKQGIRQSHLHMGSVPVDYRSTAQDSMVYQGTPRDYINMKAESRRLKQELGTHSFTLGEEKVSYETDFKAAFKYDHEKAKTSKPANTAQMVKDLRQTHFTLGNDAGQYYETDAMRAQAGASTGEGHDPIANKQRAIALKQQLMKTNYEIGCDEDYL